MEPTALAALQLCLKRGLLQRQTVVSFSAAEEAFADPWHLALVCSKLLGSCYALLALSHRRRLLLALGQRDALAFRQVALFEPPIDDAKALKVLVAKCGNAGRLAWLLQQFPGFSASQVTAILSTCQLDVLRVVAEHQRGCERFATLRQVGDHAARNGRWPLLESVLLRWRYCSPSFYSSGVLGKQAALLDRLLGSAKQPERGACLWRLLDSRRCCAGCPGAAAWQAVEAVLEKHCVVCLCEDDEGAPPSMGARLAPWERLLYDIGRDDD